MSDFDNPPADGTIEHCQYMSRLLAEVVSDDLGGVEGVGLTPEDLDRLAKDGEDVKTDFDTDHGANLANLRLMAVQEYKLRHGIPIS